MPPQKYTLFTHRSTVRLSDPGEEGACSHLFETTTTQLDAIINGDTLSYHFIRQLENKILLEKKVTAVEALLPLVADYLDNIAMGKLGIKIGYLEAQIQKKSFTL